MLALRARVVPVLLVAALVPPGAVHGWRRLRVDLVIRSCSDPAPLDGLPDQDPRGRFYLVSYRPGVDGEAETERLEATYGFMPSSVWAKGFLAAFDADTRDLLRCEPAVGRVVVYYMMGQGAGG